jgi:hypothetical protein
MTEVNQQVSANDTDLARRNFLKSCGKFAVVTPPAISLLLSTSLDSPAVAASGASNGSSSGSSDGGGSGGCTLLCEIGRLFG